MNLLILDNYDSFTYNLVHLVEQFTDRYEVHRNDEITLEDLQRFNRVLLSPGPGLPKDAGILMDAIGRYASEKSILGVCLGMQAMVECYGGRLKNLPEVMHGVAHEVKVVDDTEPLFSGIPAVFWGGRYHSWAVDETCIPQDFRVTAVDNRGVVMAVSHNRFDLKGVQFHPESVMTDYGKRIIGNWLGH